MGPEMEGDVKIGERGSVRLFRLSTSNRAFSEKGSLPCYLRIPALVVQLEEIQPNRREEIEI
jgi:hypothetical protein